MLECHLELASLLLYVKKHFFLRYFVNEPQKALSVHEDTKFNSVAINKTSGGKRDQGIFPLKVMSAKRGDWEHDYIYKNKAEEDFLFGEGQCSFSKSLFDDFKLSPSLNSMYIRSSK